MFGAWPEIVDVRGLAGNRPILGFWAGRKSSMFGAWPGFVEPSLVCDRLLRQD